jgi:hypothetical protein
MADDARTVIRRHFLRMVVLIIAIGAIALAIRHLAVIEDASRGRQVLFTAAWMLANIIVVTQGLTRIRAARVAARRRRQA